MNKEKFKIAFLGRGDLGFSVLGLLLKNPAYEITVIFTCDTSPEVGRNVDDFRQIARKNDVEFHYTNSINLKEWEQVLEKKGSDLAVAILWVRIIRDHVIKTAKHGFLNYHAGLLPRYRGNACQTWAILNGEKEQGMTVHLMEPGRLDSGPVIIQEKIEIKEMDTVGSLIKVINTRGIDLIVQAVEKIYTGDYTPVRQDKSQAMYCYPRLPRDGEIDWNNSAEEINLLVRAAGAPYPGAYTFFTDKMDDQKVKKLIIYSAEVTTHDIDFCAEPGHILKTRDDKARAVVCGDKKLLELRDVQVDNVPVDSVKYFRSVRQRLGLSTEDLLKQIHILQEQLKNR